MEGNLLHLIVSTPLFRPHQYLDPGTGSFLVQVAIAALVGIGFIVRTFRGKIKALFTRNKPTQNDDTDE